MDGPAAEPASEGSTREFILDVILEPTCTRCPLSEVVKVLPGAKGPSNLNIGEPSSRLDVLMSGAPFEQERALSKSELDRRAVFQGHLRRIQPSLLPGRQETTERTRCRVPFVEATPRHRER